MPQFAERDLGERGLRSYGKGLDLSGYALFDLSREYGIPQWKLKDLLASLSTARYNNIFFRQNIGLVAYELCSYRELETFARSKNLKVPEGITRTNLIDLLCENETFPRFVDLPAELRSLVYQEYFSYTPHSANSNDPGYFRRPPPITQVNHAIREESLSEFWSTQRFQFHVFGQGGTQHLKLPQTRFFERAPFEQRQMVKKLLLVLTVEAERPGRGGGHKGSKWELNLATKGRAATVRHIEGDQGELNGVLLGFLDSVAERPNGVKLLSSDSTAIAKIVQDELRSRK
ncbi:Hypothetical predicted protein [Lecanosticta acicola]|uniref:Uncharacterized protein n=1 Tax=Lecanosticta acicola TaxID=111012 RepID=A0AAI9E9C7_9PEZI|nr:Hypothetical predicted protein [Lecanosticta acicola]